ncbi:ESX secretion-associated protein EspG [Lentzea sp. PSKA42]|uniref:ESX secretion-associated protein EspG n=1 Tax=Lentzea indica TaxID=2604800 RepID=A0ABX1FT29_9PSEU|nr:ESX secretion-associated protein EspG [Lentzea indica]NKE62174.1 ESX secretion-associated protein EspG [Lentzea indica]
MITPDFLLTQAELSVLWRHHELGRLPYPLDVPVHGATESERSSMDHDVRDELACRGLMYDHDLTGLLHLLAEHDVAVDAVGYFDRTVRALAVSNGESAALVIIDGDQVGVLEVRPTGLARSVVDVLPDGVAGPGSGLSVPLDALHTAVQLHENAPESEDPWGDDELDERQALEQAGLSGQDAAVVAELAAGRVRGGQFGVSRVSSQLTADRAHVVINWFDTHQGRYLMVNENGWLSLAPTDNERIAHRIDSVLAAV